MTATLRQRVARFPISGAEPARAVRREKPAGNVWRLRRSVFARQVSSSFLRRIPLLFYLRECVCVCIQSRRVMKRYVCATSENPLGPLLFRDEPGAGAWKAVNKLEYQKTSTWMPGFLPHSFKQSTINQWLVTFVKETANCFCVDFEGKGKTWNRLLASKLIVTHSM